MHGGAAGSGAPIGNRNAWRHGARSAERKAELRALRALLADLRADAKRLIEADEAAHAVRRRGRGG